ncbi:hypothetical protein DFJ73DRAFT_825896 [Zopfochytrium polystomum]|nr:hypothetical protein DFJ73DRAFT_825896 [Zopfochytrium polystomum]
MPLDVRGKVALITGAASGFGKGTSARLAAKGAKLILSDVNAKAGAEVAARINASHGPDTAVFYQCDVTNSDQLKAVFSNGVKKFGRLDICINNAGIPELGKFITDAPYSSWKKVIDIDLTAVIEGTQLALHYMRNQTPAGGVIINIASMAGFIPDPYLPVYVAAKFGVVGFSKSLNKYLKKTQNVRVVGIAPTFSPTPLVTNQLEVDDGFKQMVAAGGTVPVEQVLDAIIYAIEGEDLAGEIVRITRQKGIDLAPKSRL